MFVLDVILALASPGPSTPHRAQANRIRSQLEFSLVAKLGTPRHDKGTLNKEPPLQEFRPLLRMSAAVWGSVFTEEAHSKLVSVVSTNKKP